MLSDEERRRCAEDLLPAERDRKPIPQPSRTYADIKSGEVIHADYGALGAIGVSFASV
ncbi:MAG: hypothetical protein JWN85_732 [Gammaproteobacteria bacterium]|nr:hypothetical protein [Gammaproteobacteria bacterium]